MATTRALMCAAACCALMVVAPAFAQETTGMVYGTITSPDGASLPGVTVTIDSPETGLQRTVVAGIAGDYKLAALPPGRYDLTATLDGFQTHRREVYVALGRTVKNDFEMRLGAISDVIEVTAEAPIVDVTSTVTGITVRADDLNGKIPLIHDTQQLSMLAPATLPGDSVFNGSPDGGYDGAYDQSLVSIGGASIAENAYQLNGLNITNFRTGVGSSWVPFEFVEEVQVKTGGYEAEFGRSTGGVVNMVTRSGSNGYHGSASVYFEPSSLQETQPDTVYAYNTLEDREVLEGNASLGGPLFRDRLFFFGFLQYRDTDYLKASTTRATREVGGEPYWGGKLDWNINSSHRVEGTYFTDKTEIGNTLFGLDDELRIGTDPLAEGTTNRGGENYILKYTGIFSSNVLLSAQYGKNDFDRTDASTGDPYPYAWDVTSGSYHPIGNWTNYNRGVALDEREAYRLDGDLFVGKHSLRAGIDYESNWSYDMNGYSGGMRLDYQMNGDDSGNVAYPELPADQMIVSLWTWQAAGDFEVFSNAAYIQDSWALMPNLTLNVGIRWEQYTNENIAGEPFIEVNDQYAPRLGLIWDPSGEGRSKLYGSFGVYHLPIASNTNIRMSGTELFTIDWYTVDGWNNDGTPINLGTERLEPTTVYADGEIPDVRTIVDENIEPMSQWEYILGFEQMVGDNWSVGVRGVHRDFDQVIEDIGGDYALYNVLGIEDYWWGVLANPGSGLSSYYDLDGDGTLEPVSFTADEMGYPEAIRKYYAVELTAKRRFADSFMLDFSYTWSHSYGNYEGYVDSTIGQSDGGITQLFDYPGLMDHGYGNLPNDRRHNIKVFGVYAFDMGLQVGGHAYYRSGRPISGQGVHPTDDWAASYYAASFFVQGEPAPRGSFGTTDDSWGLDLMAKYDFRVVGAQMNVRVDVFNVFDNNAVTEIDEFGDTDSGGVNPSFLQPTQYQPARSVRLGVGINF